MKLVLRGEIQTSAVVANQLKSRLPCRQDSSTLACMCRPVARAFIEVTIGFRWKDAQMSQVSERRLKELGDGLRSIEGYGGATVKLVAGKSAEKIQRATALRRKTGVSDMITIAAKPEPEGKPSAVAVKPERNAAPSNRWVRQKFVIDAVFV
ncbi:MAG: hypothetical protein H7228_12145 [Polaromonas sp.]|nr:hypothetical protein [Polaromonas sp.]